MNLVMLNDKHDVCTNQQEETVRNIKYQWVVNKADRQVANSLRENSSDSHDIYDKCMKYERIL